MSLYATLFKNYSQDQFEESSRLFHERHKRWGFDLHWFKGKKCLDAGCGGGRYVKALKELGAEVVGIDIDEKVVEVARERVVADIQVASVEALPFPSNSFDYIICMGVLNHVKNPNRGFSELKRVLRPGGVIVFGIYGNYGLRWWLGTDIWRHTVAKAISFNTLNKIFQFIGVPANKRYAVLDNLYVQYLHRFREKTVRERWLTNFHNIRRHPYERYDYRKWYNRIIYGEGWIQCTAVKK